MNNRSSIAWIGIFLAVFWVIGLMLAVDRTKVDEAALLPTMKVSNVIDSVSVTRKGKDDAGEFRFVRKAGNWYLSQNGQSIKVENFRINDLVREAREAKRDPEVKLTGSLSSYGLAPPQTTIVFAGKERKKAAGLDDDDGKEETAGPEKQWTLLLGNSSPDKRFVYVSSSEFPDRAFAVPHKALGAAFFKTVNDLRSKRLFEFTEPTVQSLALKEGAAELDAKKLPSGAWLLTKPNLGYADLEGAAPTKDGAPAAKSMEGIKPLLGAIVNVRVDSEEDFVTPASDTLQRNDLIEGKEKLRIQVASGEASRPTVETLLVGRAEGDFYYARMAGDDGAFKVRKTWLDPIVAAIKAPAELRSRDLAPISIKECDAITVAHGKEEARFTLGGDPRAWHVALGDSPRTRAYHKVVETLIDALQGRREIMAYKDVHDAEAAKVDQELGFDQPRMTASIYLQGVEAKEPALKKDAKPSVTWVFGKTEKDQVWVKRTMPDGPAARFAIHKVALDKILPREGLIGYIEPMLPRIDPREVVRIDVDRGDKTVTLERKGERWLLKDASGESAADAKKVEDFARKLSEATVRRWVRKIAANDDLESYGLKSPALKVTLTLKQDGLSVQTLTSALAQFANAMSDPTLTGLGAAWANVQLGGEKVVIKLGKEAAEKDDAGNLFVQHSKTDRLSLAPTALANLVKSADFRDRSTVLLPEAYLAAAVVGATNDAAWLAAMPLVTGHLGQADASKVRELRIAVRTPIELRNFTFVRKDNVWVEQSGLKEFEVDQASVNNVAELVAQLRVSRVVQIAGGAKADQKLTPKDATVTIDAIMGDLRVVNIAIGANFEGLGYFTSTSTWPGAVFLLSTDRVQPLLRGAGFFAKQHADAR